MDQRPILHLILKKKWFDMIASGEKKEEYRSINAYWGRIFSSNIKIKGRYYHPTNVIICFSHGYSKNRPQIKVECKGLKTMLGILEWGAEPGIQYYVLELGKII